MFLNETKKLCLLGLQQEALIVAVPNDFISVVGRYVFQMETLFVFYFAFYFVICEISRTEVAVMLIVVFLIAVIAKNFSAVHFRRKFPKPREFKMIAGMTENHDFIQQNLPWCFSSRKFFSGPFYRQIILLTSLVFRKKVKTSISFSVKFLCLLSHCSW